MKINTKLEANLPASAIWHVLGEQFAEISQWFSPVVKSSLDKPLAKGAVRTCDIKGTGPVPAGQVVEELTHFDRDSRSLTFVITSGVPKFMRLVQNAWTVEDIGEKGSRASSVVTIKLAWYALPMAPLIRMQLRRTLRTFVKELEVAAGNAAGERLAPAS